jgi:hypothetical protein
MTNLREKLTTALPDYLRLNGCDRERLALKAGVKKAYIDDMVKGLDVPEHLWRQVFKIVNPDVMQDVYMTEDLKRGQKAADAAAKHHLCIGLIGDTGQGKTMLADLLTQRENTYCFTIRESTTPRIFLDSLLLLMRTYCLGSTHNMLHNVAKKLNSLENPLLIIDEAGKLNNKMILCLHDLRNLTEKKCGMLMCGMPYFHRKLIDGRNAGKLGYSEFFRRINIWEHLQGLTPNEVNYVLEQNGITDAEMKRKCRRITGMGDLLNEINLYRAFNDEL